MAKSKSVHSYPLSYISKELRNIIASFVDDYEKELTKKASEITVKVANDFAEQLKQETPRSKNPGRYEHLADTVIVSEKGEKFAGGKGKVLYVHFTKWQIAHLLEFGWTTRNGKKITRTPFVRPLFDKNKERYYNMYKDGLK